MNVILAIETATDACSVALVGPETVAQCYEIAPRQHSQRIFSMLDEVLPGGGLPAHGVEAIAYGCGPGSFTGLRIAASAVQGLAYATGLPAIPVSTLAAQVQTAYRLGHLESGQSVFSALDARIGEVYFAWFTVDEAGVTALTAAQAAKPGAVSVPDGVSCAVGIGSGCRFLDDMPAPVQGLITGAMADILPQARDLVPLARMVAATGGTQSARQVQPVYVRDEVSWKKLSEQGKQA